MLWEMKKKKKEPIFTVIFNVWNADNHVVKHLESVIDTMLESWELIVVFDGCTDDSVPRTLHYLDSLVSPENLVRILAVSNRNALFETSANNIGMRAASSRSKYYILMQDDMLMTQKGWNSLLVLPLRLSTRVISASGRCSHGFRNTTLPIRGRCRGAVPLNSSDHSATCTFYVRDTSNRGPLVLDAEKTKTLGYFDEFHFHLGSDDHDLHARAYFQMGWVTGFVPIGGNSQAAPGGTRRPYKRPPAEAEYVQMRAKRRTGAFQVPQNVTSHDVDVPFPNDLGCPNDFMRASQLASPSSSFDFLIANAQANAAK